MAVVVAGDIPDPRDRESYLTALDRVLVDAHLAMGGSVLTLFTNRRDMEDLYAALSQDGPCGSGAQLPAAQLISSSPARPVYQRTDLVAFCAQGLLGGV